MKPKAYNYNVVSCASARADFGIANIPCTLDESYQPDTLLMTMGEICKLVDNNICYVSAVAEVNSKTFVMREPVIVCYYNDGESEYQLTTCNMTFATATLDDYPVNKGLI